MRQHTKVGALVAGAALVTGAFASSASADTNVGSGPIPAGSTPVNLLTVNDFHGRIDDGNLTGARGKNFACTMITQRAALGASNTVTVGAGDLINASTFASQVQHEEPTIDFLGAVGLQVSSVGNHEFDSGFADLTGRIIPRAHEHGFEYVGANIYTKGTKTPAMKSYEVYTVNGVRVALEDGSWVLVRASSNKPEIVVVVESTQSDDDMRALFRQEVKPRLARRPQVGAYNQEV